MRTKSKRKINVCFIHVASCTGSESNFAQYFCMALLWPWPLIEGQLWNFPLVVSCWCRVDFRLGMFSLQSFSTPQVLHTRTETTACLAHWRTSTTWHLPPRNEHTPCTPRAHQWTNRLRWVWDWDSQHLGWSTDWASWTQKSQIPNAPNLKCSEYQYAAASRKIS